MQDLGTPGRVLGRSDKHTYNLIIDRKARGVGEDSAEDGGSVDLASGEAAGEERCSTGAPRGHTSKGCVTSDEAACCVETHTALRRGPQSCSWGGGVVEPEI